MTKLEELKAAYDAAYAAYIAELKKTKENQMTTKLEELKAARDALDAACDATCEAACGALDAAYAANFAYQTELNKQGDNK